MSFSAALETFIGLVFLYLLLSLIGTWVNEGLASIFQLRARALEKAIENLIKDPKLVQDPKEYWANKGKFWDDTFIRKFFVENPREYVENKEEYFRDTFIGKFYDHAVVKALGKEGFDKDANRMRLERKPSYIEPSTFAVVAMSIMLEEAKKAKEASGDKGGDLTLPRLIEHVPYPEAKEALWTFYNYGATTVDELRSEVEIWFNQEMDRLSGWYKRRVQLIAFVLGVVLAVGLNADTLLVASTLYRDPILRSSVTEYVREHADEFNPSGEADTVEIPVKDIRMALVELEYPMGWTTYAPRSKEVIERARAAGKPGPGELPVVVAVSGLWLGKLLGWFLTALAVSMGAPFWFDLLNELVKVNLRSSGNVPGEKERRA